MDRESESSKLAIEDVAAAFDAVLPLGFAFWVANIVLRVIEDIAIKIFIDIALRCGVVDGSKISKA